VSGPERVRVDLGARAYDVHVGPESAAAALGDALSRLHPGRVALIADTNVVDAWAGDVRAAIAEDLPVEVVPLPPGESAKSIEVVGGVARELVRSGFERGDLVVGLGGGAATDVAGFVAATLLRGVGWTALPTSLLGMVDASVGGKTGVNLPEGKNLVGAFWQPVSVGCEPKFLRTLPERELRAGWAEVVKTAWIGDPGLVELLEDGAPESVDDPALPRIVRRCVAVKARIVTEDEREGGLRATLNFGHTFGHALETEAAGALLHGEAVSLGLVAAVHLSVACGRSEEADLERMVALLGRLGLPTRWPGLDPDAVLARTRHDKKRTGGADRYQLTTGVGSVSVSRDIPPDAPRAALEFLRR
jgi:3-dehydroquinate synthase